MKIGIDLRRVALAESDGPTSWLLDILRALVERADSHTYVLFHTVFNYHLFPLLPANVVRHTLSTARYYEELQNLITFEGDFDLLLRTDLDSTVDHFPLERQIVCVASWPGERVLKPLASDVARTRLRQLHTYQTRIGAIAVPSEAARRELVSDPWTTIDDVFVLPPESVAGAAALSAAFGRVAERAARPESRVRVSTPPVVSIITPSFNQGVFIRQTIESVLQQDYPHIDYQVIDGGSTDETLAILKSYGDRVKWVSEKDCGQTHAINKGMAQARGDILTYLNSDDLLRTDAVSRVVRHFRDSPTCDLVYGRDAMIDVRGNYLKMYPTAEFTFDRLVEYCCISQPAAFWRKRLADVVGPFDESLQLVMDYDYWLRADRAGGVIEHIPDVLAHTRVHRDSKSSGAGQVEAYQRKFYRELFDISYRHAGYISSHYIHLWLYTSVFVRYPWTRRHQDLINHLCQKWYHYRFRCGWSWWRTARMLFAEDRWLVARRLLSLMRWVDPRRWFRPAPLPRVKLEEDLWLGPELTVPHAGGPVRLAGVPARDSVLRVYRGDAELAAVPLQANEPADVCVDIPVVGPIRITFSASETLPDGRRVSFKLHGTTLFSERDAA